jgi:hypothetical protein
MCSTTYDSKMTSSASPEVTQNHFFGGSPQESYTQLVKFVADLTKVGEGNINLDQDEISSQNGRVRIRVERGASQSTEKNDYQERVDALVREPRFQAFVNGDEEKRGDKVLWITSKHSNL